ncbi:Flavin-dependent oxidoreductase, luciferase family (includes alkanesulfonate monooxygenase SsuD and methylene tetrahydromethanopterin reductase) [Thermomonospora echinospora]|uniref:Flavin-dependent oxidoreductase, luciferase family (Includes alkanesulfonate monooxygenase SsuD and methylene tetrahydromethanopterin reductase) n=1 Tax=Thermomonospora echinospora TaxID=1992 RepID=A0A1H6DFP6_9ACTN|nr:LLM class flavin-dependent oxidoreductase [Thermomonospora echinospora]SEG83573.1 Flavin-dependent oxidoreductase, luciferase family (includes alkanesulfonate monooxygenase SsuD and methylene tetrahydromethanopterin reductase) [Thermomonospora echinospora]
MRHGVMILPEHPWPRAREVWTAAERLGFDHAWTYDHLMWRWFSDRPWYATMPTLTAAAAVTSRIRLGMLVASPNFRHPVNFAKELVTLDDVSAGRLVCGVGAGAEGFDSRIRGDRPLTARERGARFAEFTELLDRLLRDPQTTFHGDFYTALEVRTEPGCVQSPRIPLAVAAAGPRGMALAARLADTWVTTGAPNLFELQPYAQVLPVVKDQMAEVDRACEAVGRDPATLRRLLVTDVSVGGVLESAETYRDAAGLYGELGITDLVVHWPRPDFPYQGRVEVLEEVAETVLGGGPAAEETK